MASSYVTISIEEFKAFHTIDRKLYRFMVMNLWRDPVESMQIVALWLWLERVGFNNIVVKILSLPYTLINQISDEAVICLSCINNDGFFFDNMDIPLIQSLMDKEISLKYFHMHRLSATQGVAKIVQDVCIRAFSDIMQQAILERNQQQIIISPPNNYENRLFENNVGLVNRSKDGVPPPEDRTMFITFSKGYPVTEWEVCDFFMRSFGECIESLHMQEVAVHEQALFAKIVLKSVHTIELILNGSDKVKFNINGKHVWARKFVPKRPKFACPTFAVPNFPTPF